MSRLTRTAGRFDAKVRRAASRASSVHRTQPEAEQVGHNHARADHTKFLLHGRDGKIRERDSYGNDPYPPKG